MERIYKYDSLNEFLIEKSFNQIKQEAPTVEITCNEYGFLLKGISLVQSKAGIIDRNAIYKIVRNPAESQVEIPVDRLEISQNMNYFKILDSLCNKFVPNLIESNPDLFSESYKINVVEKLSSELSSKIRNSSIGYHEAYQPVIVIEQAKAQIANGVNISLFDKMFGIISRAKNTLFAGRVELYVVENIGT